MKADYLSHRRATSVSLLGLVIQFVLGVLLFAYAYLNGDHAAMTAAIYMGIGLLAWLGLVIIFDQHRRERIEAFETEAITSSEGAAASVFEEAGAELNVAARRLRAMYRYFAPALSLAIGGLLVGVGIARFIGGREAVSPDAFNAPSDHGFALLASLAVAASFVFARFVSGMSKQRVWQNLSAGASTIVGAALLAVLLAIGHFVDLAGTDTMLRWLQVILPVVMIVLGAEVFLNFLLELYRPRARDDLPRMSFDSRILGFAAAPDRVAASIGEAINYQFGSEVTSSWAYRLLSRWIGVLVLFGLVVGWLMTSLAVIEPHQRGIMLRFGRLVESEVQPGLHVKMPWPIDRIVAPEFVETDERGRVTGRVQTATAVRELQLGTPPPNQPGPILWTNSHTLEERFNIIRAEERFRGDDDEDVAENDLALAAVEVPVHFVVHDVERFERLGAPEERERILQAVGRRAVLQHLQGKAMPELLGTSRHEVAEELRERIERVFARLNPGGEGEPRGAGVEVLYVGVLNPHPPQDAAASFERVNVAEQNYEASLESARADRIETLTSAVGSVELAQEAADRLDAISGLRDERDRAEDPDERAELDRRIVEESQDLEDRLVSQGAGRAARILAEARAERWQRHMSARGRANRYQGQIAAHEANPVLYKSILYFEMLSDVAMDSRLYLLSEDVASQLDLDLKDASTTQDVFGQTGQSGGSQ